MITSIKSQDDVRGLLTIFSATWGAETLSEFVSSIENTKCLLAKEDTTDKVMGYIFYDHDARENFTEITDIGVDPSSRGRGFGKELVLKVCDLSKGCVRLCVKEDNEIAKSLYVSLGFEVIQIIQNYYGISHDGFRME
jgi:ribosomal protein S18 acetylase RimI-like enzyme